MNGLVAVIIVVVVFIVMFVVHPVEGAVQSLAPVAHLQSTTRKIKALVCKINKGD